MFKHRLDIAFEELMREHNSGGNILLEAISLLLIGAIIFIYALNNYNKDYVDKMLKNGINKTGIIQIQSDNNIYPSEDKYLEYSNMAHSNFIKDLSKEDCIEDITGYSWGNLDAGDCTDSSGNYVLDTSFNMSKNSGEVYISVDGKEMKCIDTLYAGEDFEKLFNVNVSPELSEIKREKYLEKYDGIIYMGNSLEKIEEGTVIKDSYGNTYIIGGSIKKGTKMPKAENVSSEVIAYEDMDYRILLVQKTDILFNRTDSLCFGIKTGYSLNDVRKVVSENAQKLNYGIIVKDFGGIFKNKAAQNKTFIDFIKQIMIVVLITVIILQVSMQSVHIIENFGNYGILYANGFSMKDFFYIFAIQNILKGCISVFITLGAGYFLLEILYAETMSSLYVLYKIVITFVLWKVILCAMAIAILSMVVSLLIFSRKQPAVIIRENVK